MTIYKDIFLHTSKGACMTNGNIITTWKVPFGMPYLPWDTGSATYEDGLISARYCETATYDLTGLSHGQEVMLQDAIWAYCVDDGSCLVGSGKIYNKIIDMGGTTNWYVNGANICVNIASNPGGYEWVLWQTLGVAGIDSGDEFYTNGTICAIACATATAGDDISISTCQVNVTSCCAPTLVNINCCGPIWMAGLTLDYGGARGWKHVITGIDNGFILADAGTMWIDNNHYIHWIGVDSENYTVPWRICQFASSFSPGPGANPSPGAAYAGNMWADRESGGGWVNLAYIGCDGNKYITASGNQPNIAP